MIVLHYGMAVPGEFMVQYERLFGGDGEGEGEGDGVINHDYSGMHASKTSSDDQRASLALQVFQWHKLIVPAEVE